MKFLLILFVLLAGCSSWHWERRGASDADYDVDLKACKLLSYSGTDGVVTNESVRRMQGCMAGKGWRKVAN